MNSNSKKYATMVFQYYDNCDCTITHATQEDLIQDGANWVGSNDMFDLTCWTTIEQAIKHSAFWGPSINFGSDFSDEEIDEAVSIINALIHDPKYCHGYLREVATNDFTKDDLIFIKDC